jgi:putative endonuclease
MGRLRFVIRKKNNIFAFHSGPIVQWIPACRQAGNGGDQREGMVYVVYAIKSSVDGRIYVGFTKDLNNRLNEHNQGRTKSTKGYKPWYLIYKEEVKNREEARNREKYLKSGCGKEFFKRMAL